MTRLPAAPGEVQRQASARRAVLVFLAVSLAMSLAIAAAVSNNSSDTLEYQLLAANLSAGHGYSMDTSAPYHPSAWRAPGYPVFLAVLDAVGAGPRGIRAFQAAVCAATVALVFALALSTCPSRPLTVAASCVTLGVPLMAATTTLLPEVINCALVLGAYLLLRYGGLGSVFGAGVLFGLATLFRPENQVVVAAVAVGLTIVSRGVRLPTVLVFGFVLALAPWVVRNWVKTGVLGVVDPIYAYSGLALGTSGDYGDPVGSLRNRYAAGGVTSAERDAYVRLVKETCASRWRERPCGVLWLKLRLLARGMSYSLDGLHPDDWSFRGLLNSGRVVPLLLRVGSMLVFGPLFVGAVVMGLRSAAVRAADKLLAPTHLLAIGLLGLVVYAEARFFIPSRLLLAPLASQGCVAFVCALRSLHNETH